MIYEKTITSWTELMDYLDNTEKGYSYSRFGHVFFRGQTNKDWQLSTSLLRIISGNRLSEEKALYYEIQSIMKFRSEVGVINDKIKYESGAIDLMVNIDMQHYSCPTRLLDWSNSPYVALYFAVNNNFESDGALYGLDINIYNHFLYLKHPELKNIELEEISKYDSTDFIQVIFSLRKNDRLLRQQGVFTVSNNILRNHCDIIQDIQTEENRSGLFRLIISKEFKMECLARLRTMNITYQNLFPELDGLGNSIREELLLRKWMNR